MPEYGTRYRNAANILQIDGQYKNMQMVQKGSAIPDQLGPSGGGYDYPLAYKTLSFTGLSNPVLVIRCTDLTYFITADQGGGSYQFFLYRDRTSSSAIEWWLFDDAKPGNLAPGWGQRIRNRTTGEVVYDTRIPPFRVTDQIYPFAMPLNGGTDFQYPAGRKYGFTPARLASRFTNQGASTIALRWEYSLCKAIASGINIGWETEHVWIGNVGSAPVTPTPYNSNLASWMVVDVTDL